MTKSYLAVVKNGRRRVKKKLGSYHDITPTTARRLAKELNGENGRPRSQLTVRNACEHYLEDLRKRESAQRTMQSYEQSFERLAPRSQRSPRSYTRSERRLTLLATFRSQQRRHTRARRERTPI